MELFKLEYKGVELFPFVVKCTNVSELTTKQEQKS